MYIQLVGRSTARRKTSTPSAPTPPQHPQKPKAPQGASILRQAFEATGRMVRPYLAELEPAAEEDFIRWAQVEVASVEGVGKNSVRCAVRCRMEVVVGRG